MDVAKRKGEEVDRNMDSVKSGGLRELWER
jgi:hypothetical protein